MLINAQAETVSIKPTFKQSFSNNRVIVPCSVWYEWTNINEKSKSTYSSILMICQSI
ncbi:SOS response-associated peptidase family protein [Vibrio profundi]|uniref:SOS response-associated peptidase family protein n=1 Tax=Vibrio profundi TaxID=1774960 RepID=UPI0037366E66